MKVQYYAGVPTLRAAQTRTERGTRCWKLQRREEEDATVWFDDSDEKFSTLDEVWDYAEQKYEF